MPASDPQPLWFKDAVIYQLHVKTFADSNGDGIGDFQGLTEQARLPRGPRRRLPLAAADVSVAVSRRWLRHRGLLQHPSELRHARRLPASSSTRRTRAGLRVITELVLNHTSDQHAWFQEARASRDNPRRD